jgi:hypothetical protein
MSTASSVPDRPATHIWAANWRASRQSAAVPAVTRATSTRANYARFDEYASDEQFKGRVDRVFDDNNLWPNQPGMTAENLVLRAADWDEFAAAHITRAIRAAHRREGRSHVSGLVGGKHGLACNGIANARVPPRITGKRVDVHVDHSHWKRY